MFLQPNTLTDVATDGFIAQQATTWELHDKSIEFIPGDTYTVMIDNVAHPSQRVGTITGNTLTWEINSPIALPELTGSHELTDTHIAAARTICGNGPAYIIPEGDHFALIVARTTHSLPTATAIHVALAHARLHNLTIDVRRAILSYAAFAGIGIQEQGPTITLSDGTTIDTNGALKTDQPPAFENLISDADLMSIETGLLLDARYPDPHTQPTADATIVATVENGYFNWVNSPATSPIRQFALTHHLPELIDRDIPVTQAQHYGLEIAAKPLLGKWAHTWIPHNNGHQLALFDHPTLRLPQPTPQAIAATILRARGNINPRRALETYAHWRGFTAQLPDDLRTHPSTITVAGETFHTRWEEDKGPVRYRFYSGMSQAKAVAPGHFVID